MKTSLVCASVLACGAAFAVDPAAPVEKVAGGFQFTEGPLWISARNELLFCDIPADRIVRCRDGACDTFRQPGGNANGLTLDRQGRLIACEQGARRVSRTEADGRVVTLADRFEDRRLNSPNDVVVRSDGAVYFTDPPFGVKREERELDFQGVYRIAPDGGALTLLARDFVKPNGLAFAPDEKTLFVADTERGHIRAFDVASDGSLANGRVFTDQAPGADGMKVDRDGTVYCAARDGLRVFDAAGKHLGTFATPEQPTNCGFGGADGRTLYITCRPNVYRVRLTAPPAAAPAASAGDWPRFRGPNGSGIAAGAKTPAVWSGTTNLAWKTALPGPGASSPIVWGDRVFVTCYSGCGDGASGDDIAKLQRHLLCLKADDGRVLWSKAVPAAQPEDTFGGQIGEHGYASHTPATDGERVYAYFGKSGVIAFDFNGAQLWRAAVGDGSNQRHWGSASSLVLWKDFVIVTASEESHSIRALDRKTGREAWKADGAPLDNVFGTPVLAGDAGREDLVIAVPGEIWGMNPETGKLRWFAQTELTGNIAPSVVADGGIVCACGGYPSTRATAVRAGGKGDVTASHVLWTGSDSSYVPTPVLHGGRLYVVNDQGFALCLDAKTGAVVFKERLPGITGGGGRGGKPFYASTVMANGLLYAVSRRLGTFVLAAKPAFEFVAQNRFEGDDSDFNATPAISGDRMFIRSNRYLYCVMAGAGG